MVIVLTTSEISQHSLRFKQLLAYLPALQEFPRYC